MGGFVETYSFIGPGAAGRLTLNGKRNAFKQVLHPDRWIRQIEEKGHGILEHNELSESEKVEEILLCGIRKTEGVSQEHHSIPSSKSFVGVSPTNDLLEGIE